MIPPGDGTDAEVRSAVEAAFRQEWGRVLSTLIGFAGDWDLAEECTQEAFALALRSWPRDGIPRRPGAWLTTAARNQAVDRMRRDARGAHKLKEVAVLTHDSPQPEADDGSVPDERLRLIFTCCHPALSLDARVALTLRSVAGLSTAEIASAFGIPEATMGQRLVRAKQKIRHAGIPYRVPAAGDLPERTSGVLAVLYLLFGEGYTSRSGDTLVRADLSSEAIRLARLVNQLVRDEPAVLGLLALLLLTDARRPARVDPAGDLVPLEEQDRALWDRAAIQEGLDALAASRTGGASGVYLLQASIAACHDTAATAQDTDWQRVLELYDQLLATAPSPFVELNRAVAVAMAHGPEAGLELLDALAASGRLPGSHLVPATRADLQRRLGRHADAAAGYREALDLVGNESERRYLQRRLDEVTTTT